MKTKVLFGAMMLAMLFVSCKQREDLLGTMEKIGDSSMRGIYVGWLVDSVNMQTTITQYVLDKDAYTGSFDEVRTGNQTIYGTTNANLVWQNHGYSEDGLSFKLDIAKGADPAVRMLWSSATLKDPNNRTYSASLLDIYKTFTTMYEGFTALNEWAHRDSTVYNDTIKTTQKYLKFDEVRNMGISWDSVQSLINYVATIQDTLHWYNKEFGKNVRDTVFYKLDSKTGLYNAIAAQGSEDSRTITTYNFVGNATETFVSVNFGYVLDGGTPQPFTYSSWTAVYDTNYYKHPESKKYEITEVKISDASWTFNGMTNGKKFSILTKGTIKTHTDKNGDVKNDEKKDAFQEFTISAFSAKDKALTLDEVKMKYQEK